jgi:hypothetical protein
MYRLKSTIIGTETGYRAQTSAGFDGVDLEEQNDDAGQMGHVPS